MRSLVRIRRKVYENSKPQRRTFRGTLAEDYDGIGQYIMVSLANSSVSSAYKSRLAAGDFGTGQVIPRGTPVTVFSDHGQLEVLSMGSK